MNGESALALAERATCALRTGDVLQRKCACGTHTAGGHDCPECAGKKYRLQPKVAVGMTEDPLEREADAVADRVSAMSAASSIARAAPRIQRQPNTGSAGGETVPASVERALSSPGQPLEKSVRHDMERRFCSDFSRVRVHTDAVAQKSAAEVRAQAYALGSDIFFAASRYAPSTVAGRHLLAHELTHVIQQTGPGADHGSGTLRRKTGDGHDLTAKRFAGNATLEAVFDNKALIQRGSKGTAVRLIQQSLLAQGYALPKFGADGDFGGETEAAVRQFQTDAGAAKLDGIVGPETMKLLDMHDPGATEPTGPRATPPRPAGAPVPPATGAVFAEETPAERFAGYDSSVNPNWLVVPAGGRRQARLTITPAAARPAITSTTPGVARVDPTPGGVVVTGITKGDTKMEARQGATLLDTLNVNVKDRREVTVDQHFMSDNAGHRTARGAGEAPIQVARLNRIWERQANVRFRSGTVDRPVVPANLGPTVMWTGAPGDGWSQVTAFATGGAWNVFWVWEYEQDATPAVDDANAGTLGGNTLSEDHDCPDGLTLAHEAGHFLSGGTLPHTAAGIMGACGAPDYDRVRKVEADAVNP